jgi:hypothetical protein
MFQYALEKLTWQMMIYAFDHVRPPSSTHGLLDLGLASFRCPNRILSSVEMLMLDVVWLKTKTT